MPTHVTKQKPIDAVQWHPGVEIPGVRTAPLEEMHYQFYPTVSPVTPAVKTGKGHGWETVHDGDWIFTDENGVMQRMPDDQFRNAYEELVPVSPDDADLLDGESEVVEPEEEVVV